MGSFNIFLIALLSASICSLHAKALCTEYQLPDGFKSEGITKGQGSTFYVGSLLDGRIYRGDLDSCTGEVLDSTKDSDEGMVVGMDYYKNMLVLAGGRSCKVVIRDRTGRLRKTVQIESHPDDGCFLNDVKIGKKNVYVTNSFAKEIYMISIHELRSRRRNVVFKTINTNCSIPFTAGQFNNNGIEVVQVDKQEQLLVANYFDGSVFLVNPTSGNAKRVKLDIDLQSPDGLLLEKDRQSDEVFLSVVENSRGMVSLFRLSDDYETGSLVSYLADTRMLGYNNPKEHEVNITYSNQFPTTHTRINGEYLVVLGRFADCAPFQPCPNVSFNVLQISLP